MPIPCIALSPPPPPLPPPCFSICSKDNLKAVFAKGKKKALLDLMPCLCQFKPTSMSHENNIGTVSKAGVIFQVI